MYEWVARRPARRVRLWHLCRSWCWQCQCCYRPPRCTMAIVKDHSTLTHSQINRKIIYPLIDLTIQINFILTMKCSQIWGGVMWIWVRGWSLWSAAPPAPHNLPVVWVMSDVRVSLMSQSDLHRSSESISCPNSWLMSLMSFCFTQSRGSKIIINLLDKSWVATSNRLSWAVAEMAAASQIKTSTGNIENNEKPRLMREHRFPDCGQQHAFNDSTAATTTVNSTTKNVLFVLKTSCMRFNSTKLVEGMFLLSKQ